MLRILVVACALAISFAAGASQPRMAAAATVQVDATNSGSTDLFSPDVVNITVGDTVQWNFTGDNPHSVTSTSAEAFDSGAVPMFPGDPAFSHTFNTAGSFTYKCIVHATMTGTVNVQAPTATVSAPTQTSVPTETPRPTDTPDDANGTSTPGAGTPTATATAEGSSATPPPAAIDGVEIVASPTTQVVARRQLPATGAGLRQSATPFALLVAVTAALGAGCAVAGWRTRAHRA